jgi:hypothetical protein
VEIYRFYLERNENTRNYIKKNIGSLLEQYEQSEYDVHQGARVCDQKSLMRVTCHQAKDPTGSRCGQNYSRTGQQQTDVGVQ